MIKHKMIEPYMNAARGFAKLSHAERKKVGGIAVTPQDVVIYSWNGRPAGDPNGCEVDGVTHPDVLHCESNLVAKAAREGISLKGSAVFITLGPCLICAKQMYQSGVTSVFYDEEYRLSDGVQFLRDHKVHVEQVNNKPKDVKIKITVHRLITGESGGTGVVHIRGRNGRYLTSIDFNGKVVSQPYHRFVTVPVDSDYNVEHVTADPLTEFAYSWWIVE